MAFLDFLKKKELTRIHDLELKLGESRNSITELRNELDDSLLNHEIIKERFSSVIDLDDEAERIKLEISDKTNELKELNDKYINALSTYKSLKKDVEFYESKADLADYGIYEPIYDFEKSDDYRSEQNLIISQLKNMVYLDNAAISNISWTIDGSVAKGRASTKKFIKLILRAFNGEADSLISKVKWNNINQLVLRLEKSFNTLNKLGENKAVEISKEYFDLKMKELILEYEYKAKKQAEKEEQRALAEDLREEEKAKRELEKATREAEKEEAYYQKILEKVKREYNNSVGDPLELQNKIEALERELIEAQLKKERALSMAQQTKRGYVYIISNIGSFGENVFKIGMTRRLEPLDRVRELGDASVPFKFDVHSLIYSDEARTLEYELHKAFSDRALNLFNFRKEFFNVSLEEIEAKVAELGFSADFSSEPEAEEYKETVVLRQSKLNLSAVERTVVPETFPDTLF